MMFVRSAPQRRHSAQRGAQEAVSVQSKGGNVNDFAVLVDEDDGAVRGEAKAGLPDSVSEPLNVPESVHFDVDDDEVSEHQDVPLIEPVALTSEGRQLRDVTGGEGVWPAHRQHAIGDAGHVCIPGGARVGELPVPAPAQGRHLCVLGELDGLVPPVDGATALIEQHIAVLRKGVHCEAGWTRGRDEDPCVVVGVGDHALSIWMPDGILQRAAGAAGQLRSVLLQHELVTIFPEQRARWSGARVFTKAPGQAVVSLLWSLAPDAS